VSLTAYTTPYGTGDGLASADFGLLAIQWDGAARAAVDASRFTMEDDDPARSSVAARAEAVDAGDRSPFGQLLNQSPAQAFEKRGALMREPGWGGQARGWARYGRHHPRFLTKRGISGDGRIFRLTPQSIHTLGGY